jgi:hypothetical protein
MVPVEQDDYKRVRKRARVQVGFYERRKRWRWVGEEVQGQSGEGIWKVSFLST